MINQKFNKAVTLMDDIYQLKEDIDKCINLKSKQTLTKRMDELQEEHDRLNEENMSNTNLLVSIDERDKINKKIGLTLEERIKTVNIKNPEIEIDLIFRNKLKDE